MTYPPLPEQPYQPAAGQRLPEVLPHHRAPNVLYDKDGRPHHVLVGQVAQPPIVLQMPQQQPGMSPAQREMVINVVLILAVVVVLVSCVCAIVIVCGGTLIGIIDTVQQNAAQMGLIFIGSIVALGWAVSKIKGAVKASADK